MSGARRVVVVGAGFAGLAAGFAGARRGDRVTLLERAPQAGGRAAGADDPIAPRVTTADQQLLALVRAAGAAEALLPLRPVRAARIAQGRIATPAAAGDPLSLAATPGVSIVQSLRLFRLKRLLTRYARHLDPARPWLAAPLDDRSLADFATLYFGRDVVSAWIEPWLAERAPVDARSASRAAFLLRWAAEREAMAGAFAAPLQRLVDALAAPLDVRTNAAVERVESDGRDRLRVVLAGATLDADAVVLAVPAPEALRIAAPVLVAAERAILAGVRYDGAISWRAPLRPGAAREALRVRAAPPFASFELRDGQLTAIARDPWASAQQGVADDALAKELAAAVERMLPGVAEPHGIVSRHPLAWPRFDVGHYRAIARLRAVEADRRAAGRPLHFAGDWLAAPTLEGAVASARAAL